MKLTVWGTRGSIPVSGPHCVRYGGDTTCLECRTSKGEVVVLDAGTGVRLLGNKLITEGCREIRFLMTHSHWDHLLGFPFFKPLYNRDTVIHFHGCMYAQRSIRTFLKETMREPFFPVALGDVAAKLEFHDDECPDEFEVGGLNCRAFPMNHPNRGFGFHLSENGRSFAFFPDNELTFNHPGGRSFDEYAKFLAWTDVLIHDSEYLPEEYARYSRGWGHTVFLDTVRLALKAKARRLVLWHINQDRTDEQADAMLAAARRAIEEAHGGLGCDMAATGMTMDV